MDDRGDRPEPSPLEVLPGLPDIARIMSDAVTVTDLHRRVVVWNDAAGRLYGIDAEDALQRPVDELFDLIVDSCEVGMRKPNPAIYELALDQLGGVSPEASVFLDDFAPNVEAARRVGCHGVVVTDPVQAMTDLDRIVTSARR